MSEAFFATSALFKRYQKAGAIKSSTAYRRGWQGIAGARAQGRKGDNRLVKGRNRLFRRIYRGYGRKGNSQFCRRLYLWAVGYYFTVMHSFYCLIVQFGSPRASCPRPCHGS